MIFVGSALQQLGERLAHRRLESRLIVEALATRARVDAAAIREFEAGKGGMGVASLARVARVLGVPEVQFLHTSVPEIPAHIQPEALLKTTRGAYLEPSDETALARGLGKALEFHQLGRLLNVERLADDFAPHPPPERDAHEEGYRLAEQVRALLPERPSQIERLGRLIENRFDILVIRHQFANRGVLGASCRWRGARLIAVDARIDNEGQLRFVLAHELDHHLSDLGDDAAVSDESRFGETDRFWLDNPPIERRANAFAAMFLCPRRAAIEAFGQPTQGEPSSDAARTLVINARQRFGLSYSAAAWHLKNLGYFGEETVDFLLTTAPSSEPLALEQPTRFDGLHRRVMDAVRQEIISRARAREILGDDLAGVPADL